MNQMGEGSSGPDPALPSGEDDGETTRASWGRYPVIRPGLADPADPSLEPATDVVPGHPPTYVPPPPQPPTYVPPRPQPPTYVPPPPQPPTYIPPPPQETDQMGEGPSGPDPALHSGAGEATRTSWGRYPVIQPGLADPADPSPGPAPDVVPGHPPTYVPPRTQPPSDIVRYGPGVPASVPASQAGPEAERVWRTGRLPKPSRRPLRLRRLFGSALTVILLAASGVVLYLHFHHAPFRVTGVEILKQTKNGCVDDVTGRIATNGAAGTVSYQWVFRPGQQVPEPLSQSVVGGQHALYVTAVIDGQAHGSASQTATLQVLGPSQGTASTAVIVGC
jgi:hypothetical protein